MEINQDTLYHSLAKICGSKNLSNDPTLLKDYSSDMSFFIGNVPKFIVWPNKVQQISKILKLANQMNFSVVPISSDSKFRHHGDTIPRKEDSIIMNLSKMNRILSIDRKNRVVKIEPGVNYASLIPILNKKGLKLLLPLYPTGTKSVITGALEREPIIIPRYHWDSSDPLLCIEVVFGTGDLFRTGTAAGPGSIKQQKRKGLAQVNPMGPTQFSPYRVIQGAQGSLGVVTWATLKLELQPTSQKIFHYQSNNIEELLDFQQKLVKYRLCDETFLLNNLNLACLLKEKKEEIKNFSDNLSKWNLIFIKLDYLEGDINDLIETSNFKDLEKSNLNHFNDVLKCVNNYALEPWRARYKEQYQDIFDLESQDHL